MTIDDDLFNVPENDEEIDGNDEDEDLDDNRYGNNMDNDEGEEMGDDNDDNDEDGDDDNEDDDDDGEEGEEGEDEGEEGEGDDDDDDDDMDGSKDEDSKFMDAKESQSKSPESRKPDDMEVDEPSNISLRQSMIQKAKIAEQFDIIPTCAIPYASECHAMAFTDGPKWILTGGEDGFIRKYDFISSIQGKSPLTMAQRHNLVDSVQNSGVINSYWENEQPLTKNELMKSNPKIKIGDFTNGSVNYEPKVNPVYALDVERNGYWCLSGTLNGGLSLYSMRYNEGQLQHYFRHSNNNKGHNYAISAIKLNFEQDKFLSGSWDKSIRQWDLNTGANISVFSGSTGQISNVAFRPFGLTDLSLDVGGDEDEESDMGSLFGSDDEDDDSEKRQAKEKQRKERELAKKEKTTKTYTNNDVFMSSSIDGLVSIWDIRAGDQPVIKYGLPNGTPPWCVTSAWSNDGDFIYVGRRNSTIEEFSLKMPHKRGVKQSYIPNVSKTLQFPKISGAVTAISTMPNDNFLLCGSGDNIRLYNLSLYNPEKPSVSNQATKSKPATPFLIIPGHQGGVLSSLYVDDTGRFMVSASGNRGWGQSTYTDTVLIYEIDFEG
ncbi:transcription factor Spt8p [[Candida] jaroonii]|uniref:Transcription factor Spt8p n=1 Tax=[Candida] jaroonii TaxID=467808 RepID=A0ACA9Y7K8_9ASCO|nr:transcription factor Spt8p [[Candida] jaroonii]